MYYRKMLNVKMVPKWCFDVDIDRLVDPRKWILKLDGEGSQYSSLALWPSGQSERGAGWSGASAPCQLQGCQISKYLTGYLYKFWLLCANKLVLNWT